MLYVARMRSIRERVTDGVLLRRSLATVEARSVAQNETIRRWSRAAEHRLRVADRLDPRTEWGAALPLYREGFIALAHAAVAAASGEAPNDIATVDDAWRALERVSPQLELGVLDGEAKVRAILTTPAPLDAEPAHDLATYSRLVSLVRRVRRVVEPRTARRLKMLAATRVLVMVVVVIGLGVALIPSLFAEKNLALHALVRLSSSHPDSTAPASGEWLVNGVIERLYGAHTNVEDNPWMMIDLQRDVHARKIVIYNRGDGWFTDCLPLVVEVAQTPTSFHRVAIVESLFTQVRPRSISLDETVRYVRLTKRGHGSFALSEVAIY